MSGFLFRLWSGVDKPLAPVGEEAGASGVAGGADRHAYPLPKGMSLSQWLQNVRANPLLDHRSTETVPGTADVVIIGSGMSGAVTALKLFEGANPPRSIVMLEARELCSGATGRNAGHCKPDQWRGYSSYAKKFGSEQALKILDNEQATWEAVVAYVREHDIDCDLWVGKTASSFCTRLALDVTTTDDVAAKSAATFEAFKTAGGNIDKIEVISDKAEAVKRSRIKNAVSVYAWDAATFYPWKVVAHIIKTCLARGLNLQTWTPAESVEPSTDPRKAGQWVVKTKRGSITTPTVVHATNAYAPALLPDFAPAILPRPHMCNRAVPPRALSGSKALQNSYGVLLPNGAIFSINPRSTADGVILFGGDNPGYKDLYKYVAADPTRRTDDSLSNFEPVTAEVRSFAENNFEGWCVEPRTFAPGEGYDYAWSGILGNTADGLPYVGAVPGKPGQWMCAGHNGHGMARIFTCAPGLVKLIQGGSWDDTGLPEVFELTPERLEKAAAKAA
ncbi:DAO-domain-containing protein [Peniophora sp. CONT]|nr:DAO-domain-containing protein [Peniophora sp. CONT]